MFINFRQWLIKKGQISILTLNFELYKFKHQINSYIKLDFELLQCINLNPRL